WKGRVIGERYGEGVTSRTALESWSMGKSVAGTLMGVLIRQGAYQLSQPAPIPEWQSSPGDPRAKIRIVDLLHMSSGLRNKAPQDPDYDPTGTYPDHLYLYTGTVNSFHYAAAGPLQWPPNTVDHGLAELRALFVWRGEVADVLSREIRLEPRDEHGRAHHL